MNSQLTIPSDEIASFCQRWQVVELALFGSAVRDDFGPDSDVDVLVRFAETATPDMFDLVNMEAELKKIFARDVDLLTRPGVESSVNYMRRHAILESAEVIYES